MDVKSQKRIFAFEKGVYYRHFFTWSAKNMMSINWRIIVVTVFAFVVSSYPVFAEEPLTLDACMEIALKNSNVITMAKEGVKGATAQKNEAFTIFLPKLNTSYSYTRLSEAPFIRTGELPPPYSLLNGIEIPMGTKNNYNWTFEVRQPLFAGGGILANYQASSIGEDAARVEETAKYQDVIQEVKIAYFNVLRTQRIKDAVRQSVEMLNAHCNIAKNFFEVGMIPKNDLLHAEVELANGQQALIRAENAVELAKSHLNTVLKQKMHTPIDVVDILTYQPLKQSFEECLSIARQERPELKISLLKIAQAEKIVRLSKSEYLPALNLVGNYTRFGDNPSTSGSPYKDMENWQVMAVASWNFWEWGKTKYRVDASQARENQATEASKELNDRIALEIKNAYLMVKEAESQIAVSRKVIKQAQENFRISEERYQQSVSTSTVVLEAQTLLTKAKSEYANALGEYNINLVKLQRAMGTIKQTSEERLKADEENMKAEKEGLKTNEENHQANNNSTENNKKSASEAMVVLPAATEKPVFVSNEQNATKPVSEDDVRNLVNQWLTSWQSGDMETYQRCYAADFQSKGMTLADWTAYKVRVRKSSKTIKISIDNLQISKDANAATAVFNQYYKSVIHKDKVKKTLKLRKVNSDWKIYEETAVHLK
jgi:outer membrane protein